MLGLEGDKLKFVGPNGEATELAPGIGLRFNLIGGIEFVLGVVSGELILSPRFDFNIAVSYADALKIKANGEASVEFRVVASLFWGTWEKEMFSGVLGPWQIFETPLFKADEAQYIQKASHIELVELPTVLPLPSMSSDTSGTVMVVWLEKTGGVGSPPQIRYSFRTKNDTSFSAAQFVVENSSYKSDPRICFNPDGTVTAVWVQNSQPPAFSNNDVSEIIRFQDIYFSRWDRSKWSTPRLVTPETSGMERSDGVPTVLASPGGRENIILWTRNNDQTALQRKGLEIYYSRVTGELVDAPRPLTNNNSADLMVRGCYLNDQNVLALWLRDEDGNSETIDDNEIYYSIFRDGSWSTESRLTSNKSQEKDFSVARLSDGRAVAAWVQIDVLPDSSLEYSLVSRVYDPRLNTWTSSEIVTQSNHFVETPIVQVDRRNIATITWRGYRNNMGGDILISLKDFGTTRAGWTSSKALTDDDYIDWMLATAIDASGNQFFVHLKSSTSSINAKTTSSPNFHGGLSLMTRGITADGQISDQLNFGSYSILADLAVDSSSIDVVDSTLLVGKISNLALRVRNLGGVISEPTIARLFAYDDLGNQVQIGSDQPIPRLLPDSSYSFLMPFRFSTDNIIELAVDPLSAIKEQSESNNIIKRPIILLPDLSSVGMQIRFKDVAKVGDTAELSLSVANVGNAPVESVAIRLVDKRSDTSGVGTIVADRVANTVKPGDTAVVRFSYVVLRPGKTWLVAQIDPSNSLRERTRANNEEKGTIGVFPDLTVDSLWYDDARKKINVRIANIGGDVATDFNTSVYQGDPLSNGKKLGQQLTHNLGLTQKTTIEYDFTASTGLVSLVAWIDEVGKVTELSKENNKSAVTFVAEGTADITARFVAAQANPRYATTTPFVVKVSNDGDKGANSISYRLTGRYILEESDFLDIRRSIPILNHATSYFDTLKIQFPETGLVKLKVSADPENSIAELNKANNQDSVIVRVHAGEPPSAPRLVNPVNDTILKITSPPTPIQFVWSRSIDPDPQDSVLYVLWLRGPWLDTLVVGIKDTTARLDLMSQLLLTTTYQWSVQVSDRFFSVTSPDTFKLRTSSEIVITDVLDLGAIPPKDYYLSENYPNPFNPSTSIQFGVPKRSHVRIEVFNILGKKVMDLLDQEVGPGRHRITFRGVDMQGNPLSSGIYLCRMLAGNFVSTKKMILVK